MQNRRAYSPFIICRSCGWVAKCRNCDVTLKYHKDPRHLSCHHCGFHAAAPARCPVCGGPKLMSPGIGTQKVEEFVRMEFPSARVLRMDSDTTGTKGAHQRIIDRFRKGECDVLVGTQMIAKGLDFPGVTLVGIISADTDLNMPDFRAEERTFQLLSQVAGRAGRGSEPGQVIVQTLAAESPVLELVARHDFAGFYRYELENRRLLAYPPFSRLIRIGSSDRSESAASGRLMAFGRELAARLKGPEGTRVYPAVPAPMKLEKGLYHYNLLIKTREPEQVSAAVWELLEGDDGSYSSLAFDPDPIF